MKLESLWNLQDKVIVLTGGSGLIGSTALEVLPQTGGQLVVGVRDTDKLARMIEKIDYADGVKKPQAIPLDIADSASISGFFAEVQQKFGRIDILINNAWPRTKDWLTVFEDVPVDSLYKNLCDHAGGYFLCCQEASRYMKEKNTGVILNMGSIYGAVGPHFDIYQGTGMTSPAAYAMIKGGIHNFTRYLATYLAANHIRVNCLCPGGVQDDSHQHPEFHARYIAQTPLGRMAKPDDIIGPMLFLITDASKYVTGQILMADGGWTAW